MKTNLLYLPLDERPCNSFAKRILSGVADYGFISPDRDMLGNKKSPADYDKIRAFLLDNAERSDVCVLSVDCLLYGGIVPSRLHNLSADELSRRLQTVAEMKRINPKLKIYAFALVMRCPSYSSSDEEPDYYEHCGREIFLTGQVKHKLRQGRLTQTQADALLKEYALKCGDWIEDYESRRAVNLRALLKVLDVANDYFEYLVIPQDDSSEWGYTAMDKEAVLSEARRRNVAIANYPGADEVGMTLVARAVSEREHAAVKVKCVYADPDARALTPLYEDRRLGDTVSSQLSVANCIAVDDNQDVTLFLNYFADMQVEAGQIPPQSYSKRDLNGFCDRIAQEIDRGGIAAVADGAYCNGGDAEFVRLLASKTDLLGLSAYAGWNTSSNTLGTAICQAVVVSLFGKGEEQNAFLAERFFEDVGYCAHTRARITADVLPSMGLDYFCLGTRSREVAQAVKAEITRFAEENLPSLTARYAIDRCEMPWNRMFEVDLTAKRINGEKKN